MATILVVDDDQNGRNLVSIHLKDEGYDVIEAGHGEEALDKLAENVCDLAIVDVMMPKMDGFELTKEIRSFYDIPVILLTAKDQLRDKEKGFLSGTDDYVVKPFEPKELVYRVKTLFRLYNIQTEDELTIGSIKINKKTYVVHIDEQSFILPLKEFELLFFLASHPSQVFSRIHLIEHIWGFDYEGDERTVDVHIKRLRERFSKITNDFRIKTVRGIGYSLEVNE